MAVCADPVNNPPFAATAVDMRRGAPVRAGTHTYDGPDAVTPWHHHDLHQIEYATAGVAEVETAVARYLLPPRQAIWIPAGLGHRTTLRGVRSVSVFFEPAMVSDAPDQARVLAATPVMREMIVYGARWPIDRDASDAVADAYFGALARLLGEWLEHPAPLAVPVVDDELVATALAVTDADLADVTFAGVCAAVGTSERTLRRRFAAATGGPWRDALLERRLVRAMALLSQAGPSVLDVAVAVGFDSPSAFSRAFLRRFGELPRTYRRRVLAG